MATFKKLHGLKLEINKPLIYLIRSQWLPSAHIFFSNWIAKKTFFKPIIFPVITNAFPWTKTMPFREWGETETHFSQPASQSASLTCGLQPELLRFVFLALRNEMKLNTSNVLHACLHDLTKNHACLDLHVHVCRQDNKLFISMSG